MHARFADIGTARGIRGNLGPDAFKLAAADVFEPLPFRSSGSRLVEVDGNLIALPDLSADVVRHGHAVFNGDAVDGDEGDYVGGSHARDARLDAS